MSSKRITIKGDKDITAGELDSKAEIAPNPNGSNQNSSEYTNKCWTSVPVDTHASCKEFQEINVTEDDALDRGSKDVLNDTLSGVVGGERILPCTIDIDLSCYDVITDIVSEDSDDEWEDDDEDIYKVKSG